MYETINSPINYGGLELKNRIIFAPTTFGLAEDEYFEKIRKIAAGGCAMVIIGDVPVGKSQFEKSLFDKKGFAHYQKLVEIVHSYDCRICAQLHQTDSNMLAMLKYVPGVLTKKISMEELRPLLNAEVAPYISKLSARKIHKIINGFGEAAVLAVKAGFDMVQVHGDRMCGSFSSTVFNHRTDEYGGSAENRARFAVEAVKAIRSRLPEIGIRKAFGATKGRLLVQILSENMFLTLLGGVVGLLFSYIAIFLLRTWLLSNSFGSISSVFGGTPMLSVSELLNPVIFLYAFLFCLILNLLSAGIPAYRMSRKEVVEALNEN